MNISNQAIVQIVKLLGQTEQLYRLPAEDQKIINEATIRALTALLAEKKAAAQAERAIEAENNALHQRMHELMREFEGINPSASSE